MTPRWLANGMVHCWIYHLCQNSLVISRAHQLALLSSPPSSLWYVVCTPPVAPSPCARQVSSHLWIFVFLNGLQTPYWHSNDIIWCRLSATLCLSSPHHFSKSLEFQGYLVHVLGQHAAVGRPALVHGDLKCPTSADVTRSLVCTVSESTCCFNQPVLGCEQKLRAPRLEKYEKTHSTHSDHSESVHCHVSQQRHSLSFAEVLTVAACWTRPLERAEDHRMSFGVAKIWVKTTEPDHFYPILLFTNPIHYSILIFSFPLYNHQSWTIINNHDIYQYH